MPLFSRLSSELYALQKAGETISGIITVVPEEGNFLKWNIKMRGPAGTPFENGTFDLTLTFPDGYPEKPPVVKFSTKVFHPNVYNDGSICLDILGHNWTPRCDVSLIITALRDFLVEPNPRSPANIEAAMLYVENIDAYNDRVRRLVRGESQRPESGEISAVNCQPSVDGCRLLSDAMTPEIVARIRLTQDFNKMESIENLTDFQLNVNELQITGHMFSIPVVNSSSPVTPVLQSLTFFIKFSADYPIGSITISFPDKPFHPNISMDGQLMGDYKQLLGYWYQKRHPSRLTSLLTSIRSLFFQQNINNIV